MLKFVVHPTAGDHTRRGDHTNQTVSTTTKRYRNAGLHNLHALGQPDDNPNRIIEGQVLYDAGITAVPIYQINGVTETSSEDFCVEKMENQLHPPLRRQTRSVSVGPRCAPTMDMIREREEACQIYGQRKSSDLGYWSNEASRRSSYQPAAGENTESSGTKSKNHVIEGAYQICQKTSEESNGIQKKRHAWSRQRSRTVTEGLIARTGKEKRADSAPSTPKRKISLKQRKSSSSSGGIFSLNKKRSKSIDFSWFHKTNLSQASAASSSLPKNADRESKYKKTSASSMPEKMYKKLRIRSRSMDGMLDTYHMARDEDTGRAKKRKNSSQIQKLVDNLGLFFHKNRRSTSESNIYSSVYNYQLSPRYNLNSEDSLTTDSEIDENHLSGYDTSDEEDQFYSSVYSSAMQKAKTPSTTHRIIPKKWRTSKSNKMPNGPNKNLWTPEGSCTWSQMGGRKIVLGNTTLLNLSEVERLALQKIAVAKLQALNLGCAITIPKEGATPKRNKRSAFSLKRYRSNSNNNSSNIGNFILDFRDKRVKDKDAEGKVFGIPLAKCICNDQETRRRRSGLIERRGSLDFPPRRTRKSSCSSTSSIENIRAPLDGDTEKEQKQAVTSSESLSGSDHSGSSPHLEVPPLVRSVSSPTNNRPPAETHILDYRPSLTPSCPQVPNVVNTCLKHLETYGLRTLGIFRVGSSKKRTKQLREEFDSCQDVKLNEEHNPHDVAALLKEFFRDLPEPIMSRELYNAFVATRKLKTSESQLSALRLLVSLLPVPNRDTLWALVKFLLKVSEHSNPTFDETGQELPGNKMDTHNLATLFGPNILHKIKGGASQEFQVESMDRAEERREIITCIQDLIEHHTKIFQVPAELHDDILRHLLDTKPDAIDYLLNQMTHNHQISIEIDPDTSVTFEEIVYPENQTGSRCLRRTETFNGQQRDSPHRSLRQTLSSDGTAATAAAKDYLRVPVRRATRCRISDNLKNIYRRSAPEGSLVTEDECASSGKNKEPVLEPAGSASSSIQSLEVPNVISPRRRRHFREKRTPNLTINIAEELSGSTSSGYSSQRSPSCSKDFNSSTSSLSSYNPSSSRCSLSPARHPPVEIHRWSLSPPANSSSAKSNPNSPRIHSRDYKYATSSLTRPLGVHAVETRGDEDPPVGSVEWQRERWRHWQTLARRVDDSDEQETLV